MQTKCRSPPIVGGAPTDESSNQKALAARSRAQIEWNRETLTRGMSDADEVIRPLRVHFSMVGHPNGCLPDGVRSTVRRVVRMASMRAQTRVNIESGRNWCSACTLLPG